MGNDFRKIPLDLLVKKDADTITDSLGMSVERGKEIVAMVNQYFREEGSITLVMERLVKELDGKELLFAIYSLGFIAGYINFRDNLKRFLII